MEANAKRAKKYKGGACFWTTSMDEVLLDAYLHQQTMGNKNGNCMTTAAMDSILQEMRTHFPDKPISKEKIKDHMKHIKTKFNACYDLFKNGLSGFAWDAMTSMWIAEPEVWDKLIESKPEAVEWRNKLILFYDKLAQLFGKDRATGEHEESPAEMRARKATNGGNNNNDTIEEIDNLMSANRVTLESFEVDEEVHPSAGNSEEANAYRNKKRAKRVVEDDTNMGGIAKSLQKIADVFEKKSDDLRRQKEVAIAENIWAQLEGIGIEPASLSHVYVHLVQHPEALIAFNGAPVHKRKEILAHLVPGYSPSY